MGDVLKGAEIRIAHARWKPFAQGDMVLLLGDGDISAGDGCAIAFHSGFRMASSVLGGSEMNPLPRFMSVTPRPDVWAFVQEKGLRRSVLRAPRKMDLELIAKASAERRFAMISVMGSEADETALYRYSIPPPQRPR